MRIRPNITSPQPMTLIAISGTDSWRALSPLARRTFVIASENGMNIPAAVRSANAANQLFMEADILPTAQKLLKNPDFQAVVKMFTEPVPVGTVARAS
jgi:hypothetical protein